MDIKSILYEQNPWWTRSEVPQVLLGEFKREIEETLIQTLTDNKATVIFGPRRAGKTTTLFKLTRDLLMNKRVNPQRIFFLNFENLEIRKLTIRELLNHYLEILGESSTRIATTIFLFFDEIHHLKRWSSQVKELVDSPIKVKIIASGSSSFRIIKGGGESLVGRASFFKLYPFSFFEFLQAKFPKVALSKRLKNKDRHQEILLLTNEYNKALENYFDYGGFPEVFMKDSYHKNELIKTYKSLILQRDILELKKIEEPLILSDLYDFITDKLAGKLSITNLSSDLGIKFETAKKYLSYLEEAHLIKMVKPFFRKKTRALRKERKLFFIDNALSSSFLLESQTKTFIPQLSENTFFTETLRHQSPFEENIFYAESRDFGEVDFVLVGKKLFAFEIKYQNDITAEDETSLIKFVQKNPDFKPILITKRLFDFKTKIKKIPLFLFLLSDTLE